MHQPMLYLPDITNLIVGTRVREVDLYKVKVGQQAVVRIDAYPELSFPAEVQFIGALAAADQSDRGGGKYFQVTLALTGQDRRLRPGMTARVHIKAEDAENVLLLPVQAVFRDNDGITFSYLSLPSGLHKTAVTIGRENELQVEVLSGLKPGDQVSLVPPQAVQMN
jgi:HlyD family secretion protein